MVDTLSISDIAMAATVCGGIGGLGLLLGAYSNGLKSYVKDKAGDCQKSYIEMLKMAGLYNKGPETFILLRARQVYENLKG